MPRKVKASVTSSTVKGSIVVSQMRIITTYNWWEALELERAIRKVRLGDAMGVDIEERNGAGGVTT